MCLSGYLLAVTLTHAQQPDASGVIQMAMMPADQAQLDLDGFLDESVWQQVPATDASGNGTYGYY
jgi:hypothetical protein